MLGSHHKLSFRFGVMALVYLSAMTLFGQFFYSSLLDARGHVRYLSDEAYPLSHHVLEISKAVHQWQSSIYLYAYGKGDRDQLATDIISVITQASEKTEDLGLRESFLLLRRKIDRHIQLVDLLIPLHQQVIQTIDQMRTKGRELNILFDKELQGRFDHDKNISTKKVQIALDMEINVHEAVAALEAFVSTRAEIDLKGYREAMGDFARYRESYRIYVRGKQEGVIISEIDSLHADFSRMGERLLASFREREDVLSRLETSFHEILNYFDSEMLPIVDQVVTDKRNRVFDSFDSIIKTTVGQLALILVFSLFLLFFFAQKVVSPIKRLANFASNIGQGDFSGRIDVKSKDEIGVLSQMMNVMIEKINVMFNEIKNSTKAEEEARAQVYHASKMASVGQLAAGVAHEVNNPLTIIRLGVDDLEDHIRQGNSVKVLSELEHIKSAVLRVASIIQGLKTYSRMDADLPEKVNFTSLIRDTLRLLRPLLDKENIVIEENFKDELYILGVPGKIQQVIMNLILNARDSMVNRPNSVLKLTLDRIEKNIILSVSDNGVGVAIEHQNKIFDAFFTTKATGEGLGLGLSLSYAIVKGMNGEIRYQAAASGGAEFLVIFPAT
jgi:signal transduction histidine kinase